jgi:hypothetical protein
MDVMRDECGRWAIKRTWSTAWEWILTMRCQSKEGGRGGCCFPFNLWYENLVNFSKISKLVKFTYKYFFFNPIFWGQNNEIFSWKTSTDAQEEVIQVIWMRKKRMNSKLRNWCGLEEMAGIWFNHQVYI